MLIAEMAAKRAGEVLCGELLRRDLSPTTMQVQRGGNDVLIVLTILGDWSKGFTLARENLTPEAIERDLETWKARVRGELAAGNPSQVVQDSIRRYGAEAVQAALAPRFGLVT